MQAALAAAIAGVPPIPPPSMFPAPELEGAWYDAPAAEAACDFFPTFLRFTKDRWAGKPFMLEEWQKRDIVRPLFGWKRRDGTRVYRRAIIFLPRKNGKTELAAGLALLMMFFDGLYGAEVYALAKTEDQARIVYEKAGAMVAMCPALSEALSVTKKSIYCVRTDSFFKPLDGKAGGKHGLNASGLVADELHEWRNGELYTTVHQSEAARDQPLEILISTAGVRGNNFGWEVWQEAEKLRNGTLQDPSTLVVIYAAEPTDDWTTEATWRKANPNLAVSVSLEYLREECEKAKGDPKRENDFRRYHLNQWTGQAVRWIPLHKWDLCTDGGAEGATWGEEDSLTGRVCFGGLDLSSRDDFTALAYAFPPLERGQKWRRLYRIFIPEERLEEREKKTGVSLQRWIRAGALLTTPGNSVDYDFVVEQVLKDAERFDLQLLGVDRWNALHFSNRAVALGVPLEKIVLVGQGYASMSEPSKQYALLVDDGLLDHGGHPVVRWMVDNVMITRDPAGNIKPAKDKSAEKIDGVVADIIAQFVALSTVESEGVGVISI